MRLVIFALVIAVVVLAIILAVSVVRNGILKRKNNDLTRLINGLDEPELWLPEAERQEHARRRLQREEDEYQEKRLERAEQALKNFTTPTPKEGNTL